MTTCSKDELRKIAAADDLHISPLREDGVTYGTPTWIWSVAADDALYVRAYNRQNSRWYQAAVRQRAGRITAAGMMKEVTFEPVDVCAVELFLNCNMRRAIPQVIVGLTLTNRRSKCDYLIQRSRRSLSSLHPWLKGTRQRPGQDRS
jgi:hypothetical protein